MSLSIDFLGVTLRNRTVLASGILGVSIASLRKVYNTGAGIVTTKSVGPRKRKGHPAPVVFDWDGGLINAVGLSNPGVDDFAAQFAGATIDFPLIISLFGENPDDFFRITQRLDGLSCTFFELNLSCPNVLDEFGTPFSYSRKDTARITSGVKALTDKPVIVKLSSNTPELPSIAQSAEDAGADALCIMNTVGPGMVIDIHTGAPVLANRAGGLSGPAVLPLTVRSVYEVYRRVAIPIVATGGIQDLNSALQVIMAGAALIGIGSAVYTVGLSVFNNLNRGLALFLKQNGLKTIDELVGMAHGKKKYTYLAAVRGADRVRGSMDGVTGGFMRKNPEKRPSLVVLPVHSIQQSRQTGARTLFFSMQQADTDRHLIREPLPGQFYMLWLPGVDQKPFSVSFFDGETIGFSLQKRGAFTHALCELREGDPVGLLGPLGTGFDLNRDNYILVGGGIGCAPLVYAAARLLQTQKHFVFVAGGKTAGAVNWIEGLLRTTYASPLENIVYCTEDGSLGEKGMITELLEGIIEVSRPSFALVCGPELCIKKTAEIFSGRGIEGEAGIERLMKCGIGICGSCSVDQSGDRVCAEGPVFSFEELESIEEFGRYRRDQSGSVIEDV